MDIELPFLAEYAKSSRSKCKGCKNTINAQSLRMAIMVQVFEIMIYFQGHFYIINYFFIVGI